jgi:hypothetical protein
MNRWFRAHRGLLVVETVTQNVLGWPTTCVYYTNTLTREELEEFDTVNREVQAALEKRKAVRAEAQALEEIQRREVEEKKKAAELEQKKSDVRYIQMGKYHESHCKEVKSAERKGKN